MYIPDNSGTRMTRFDIYPKYKLMMCLPIMACHV